MVVTSTVHNLSFDKALLDYEDGAAFIDLRPIDDYLDVHIPSSLALLYEFGPGMASRARDCLPLSLPLILLDLGGVDLINAAAALRGKGFTVLGKVEDGINQWAEARGVPASTDTLHAHARPEGTVLDVGDPGLEPIPDAIRIPIERLWSRVGEIRPDGRLVVASRYGVRAALAVGMLERTGIQDILFWIRRPA